MNKGDTMKNLARMLFKIIEKHSEITSPPQEENAQI
jgi:hypothetical protein